MPLLIDPPEGHLYGFPKTIPDERLKDYKDWLVEEGYPKERMENYIQKKIFRCRFIGDIQNYDLMEIL